MTAAARPEPAATRALPPDHSRDPRDAEAGGRRGQRTRRRDRRSLALACDLVIAAESAFFVLAFVNIGLVPGGSTAILPARVGAARTFEMALLGERVPGHRARLGDRQPTRPGRRARVRAGAARPARRRPDPRLRERQAAPEPLAVPLAEQLEPEAEAQLEQGGTTDFIEGVLAFAEKRPPAHRQLKARRTRSGAAGLMPTAPNLRRRLALRAG